MNDIILEYDAFLRAIANYTNGNNVSIFLGAGASIASGANSATDCIWDWKKEIYNSNNINSPFFRANIKNPKCREEVQNWIDKQNYKITDDEYSFFAEKAYQIQQNRSQYFSSKFIGLLPSVGYQILALMGKYDFIKRVWTTNFDDLLLNAASKANVSIIDVTTDSSDRINNHILMNQMMLVKLHGDYKYCALKNTTEEVREQNEQLTNELINDLKKKDIIITGYSGRDKSIMAAFKTAISQEGTGIIFWTGIDSAPNSYIKELINEASQYNRNVYYIQCNGFDSLMLDIAQLRFANKNDILLEISNIKQANIKIDKPIAFKSINGNIGTLLMLNTLYFKAPNTCFQFEPILSELSLANEKCKRINSENDDVSSIFYYGKVFFYGNISKISNYFTITGSIDMLEFNTKTFADKRIFGRMILQALIKGLVVNCKKSIASDGSRFIWSINTKKTYGLINAYDGIEISIGRESKYTYFSIKPKCYIDTENIERGLKKKIQDAFYYRINNGFKSNPSMHLYLSNWRNLLCNNEAEININFANLSNCSFKIKSEFAYVGINGNSQIHINQDDARIRYRGMYCYDPDLLFYNETKNQLVTDFHPMRGLINNAPYDNMYASQHKESIKLAIVCPKGYEDKLQLFIAQFNQKHSAPINSNYLLSFNGFYDIFGIPLNIPTKNDILWQTITCDLTDSEVNGANNFCHSITSAIQRISDTGENCIVLIYIPNDFSIFKEYNNGVMKFDLHDQIKAYSIPQLIPTQLLNEDTIDDFDKAAIFWTLSLALYVKSGRTPWIINTLRKASTAYIGLGYSVDISNQNAPVVLGCSHIYSGDGQSLKYRLSKIRDPQFDKNDIHKKNPYLSEDEAYSLGCKINDMCRKSFGEFPQRVVIHKRTPFRDSEVKGLTESLLAQGVKELELLEINFEDNLSFIKLFPDGKPDNYSVERGVCFPISENVIEIFTHGVARPITNKKYILGAKSLPQALRIHRYYGNSDLKLVAEEFLGLTRMNWNNFNLYSKLPCTIESSNNIARIANLLSHYSDVDFDYRFFM